jgi:hypothetical protein
MAFSVVFASAQTYFYAYGRQFGQNRIGLFKTSDGTKQWVLFYTRNSASDLVRSSCFARASFEG